MSDRLELLALERQLLVARSGLCRLRLRSRSMAVRRALSWPQAAAAAAATPAASRAVFDVAVAIAGTRRAERAVRLAGRALAIARFAWALAATLRPLPPRPGENPASPPGR